MKRKTIFTILLAIIASTQITRGQEVFFTLDECRAIAVDSSKQMLEAKLMEEKMNWERKAVLTNFFPKFSGYGMYLYSTNKIDYDLKVSPVLPAVNLAVDLANTVTAGVAVQQPVFMGGKIATGYKMAKIGRDMTFLNTKMKQSETILSVDEAYWLYVKTCKLLEAAQSFSETVTEMEKFVNDAIDVGMASQNDILKVQVQINNAKLMIAKAGNGKNLARMNLCHAMGIPLETELEVDQSNFGMDGDLLNTANYYGADSVFQRYDYQLLEKKTELKRKNIAFTRSDFLPQIGVIASYGYTYGVKFQNDPLFDNGGFGAVASIKIPILAWGEGYMKVQSAKKDYEMSVAEMDRLEEMMTLERAQNENAVNEAKLQIEMTETALKDAENNLKSMKDQYELGMETLVNVLEAQTQWNKSNSDYIEAVADYKLACTRYLKSIGRLL